MEVREGVRCLQMSPRLQLVGMDEMTPSLYVPTQLADRSGQLWPCRHYHSHYFARLMDLSYRQPQTESSLHGIPRPVKEKVSWAGTVHRQAGRHGMTGGKTDGKANPHPGSIGVVTTLPPFHAPGHRQSRDATSMRGPSTQAPSGWHPPVGTQTPQAAHFVRSAANSIAQVCSGRSSWLPHIGR